MFDVIIVGAGPAGIACALRCRELNLNPLLLEQGVIANTIVEYPEGKTILGVPGFFQAAPGEIVEFYKKDLLKAKIDVREGHKVISVKKKDGFFEVVTKDCLFKGLSVVLSIGVQGLPQTLGVEGEDMDNVYYKLRDPKDFFGRNVLVVGGGNTAIEAAYSLANAGARTVLSYRRSEFHRVNEMNLSKLNKSSCEVKFLTNVAEIKRKSVILRHATDYREEVLCDDIFVFVGSLENKDFFIDIGIEMDEQGMVVHDLDTYETNIPGIFVAGDITREKQNLIMPAKYQGFKVAGSVLAYKGRLNNLNNA